MPNRTVYMTTISCVGTITAFRLSETRSSHHRLHELVGGFLGGLAGGRLSDILEPPLNPNHRGVAHSVSATGAILSVAQQNCEIAQQWLRDRADILEIRAESLPANPFGGALLPLIANLCRIAAGFLAGPVAGYVTHAALDAFTSRSVRLA